MGRDLFAEFPAARQVLQQGDEALDGLCSELLVSNEEDACGTTENAQPAILTVSVAALRALQDLGVGRTPEFVLGHSLGEFSSMVAAGVLNVQDALRLVRARGVAMRKATRAFYDGTGHEPLMNVLMPISPDDAGKACAAAREALRDQLGKLAVCQVAGINAPSQVTISGTRQVVERACEVAKSDFRCRRAVALPVDVPFHSEVMRAAQPDLKQACDRLVWNDALVPMISNVTAEPVLDGAALAELALSHLYSPVRWEESICRVLRETAGRPVLFIELGASVVGPLAKSVAAKAPEGQGRALRFVSVADAASLAALAADPV